MTIALRFDPRSRRPLTLAFGWLLAAMLCLAPCGASADDEAKDKIGAKPAASFELTVNPAAEPVPALKYQLLTPVACQIPGNAAPIYLRIMHEQNDEWRKVLGREPGDLLDMPSAEMPLDKAAKLLERFDSELEELSAAGRRRDCDWEYVLENRDPLKVLLPDAQSMRSYARLLALQARCEALKGNFAAAISATQDNVMLAQHVAKAPFLVNRLIGYVITSLALEQLDVLVERPGGPSLYWALACVPRPVVSFAPGADMESGLLELKFPELKNPDVIQGESAWRHLALRMRAWARQVVHMETFNKKEPATELAKIDKAATAEQLATARAHLKSHYPFSAETVQAMSDAEVEVRFTVALFHEISDGWRRWFHLPVRQALPGFPAVIEKLRAEGKRREIYPLVSLIVPIDANLVASASRCDRMRARLQTIEAMRLHAAATGKLPAKLSEITVVPVPDDPATGEPFRYALENGVATIDAAEELGTPRDALRLPVRVRLRGK